MGFYFTVEKVEDKLRELGFSEEEIIKLWLVFEASWTPPPEDNRYPIQPTLIEKIMHDLTFYPERVNQEYIQRIRKRLRIYELY